MNEEAPIHIADFGLRQIPCALCPQAIPARMDRLLDHARSHDSSLSSCFPIGGSEAAVDSFAAETHPDPHVGTGP